VATVARLAAFAVLAASCCATAGAVDPSRLSSMPLTRAALGKDGVALFLAVDSGVDTNTEAARNAGHGITGADLTRDGRISGYTLHYYLPDAAKPQNLLGVQTIAELYRNGPSAVKGVSFWRQVTESLNGIRSGGVTVALAPFHARVGDTSFAYELTYQRAGAPIGYLGDIVFRTGNLLGAVFVTTRDEPGLQARTLKLANRLLAKMRRVSRGG